MTTMLEKMARAMYPQAFQDTAGEPPVIVRRVADYREQAFTKARAALQAIRGPGDVRHLLGQLRGNGTLDWEADDGQTWTVLIDAILSEGEA